ncbi:hypothetical protein ABPG72_001938 [Tetrahymena utriculariae]
MAKKKKPSRGVTILWANKRNPTLQGKVGMLSTYQALSKAVTKFSLINQIDAMRRKKDQVNHSLHQFLKPLLIKSYHFLSALNGPLGVHCDHNQNKVFQDNSNQESHGDIKTYHQRSILIHDIFQSFQQCKKQCPRLLFRKAKCQSYPSVTCRSSELENFVFKKAYMFQASSSMQTHGVFVTILTKWVNPLSYSALIYKKYCLKTDSRDD